MNEFVIARVYTEFEPKIIADYGFILYDVISNGNNLYLRQDCKIRTTFLRESIIYELKQRGYIELNEYKKMYNITNMEIKQEKKWPKIKRKIINK